KQKKQATKGFPSLPPCPSFGFWCPFPAFSFCSKRRTSLSRSFLFSDSIFLKKQRPRKARKGMKEREKRTSKKEEARKKRGHARTRYLMRPSKKTAENRE